MLNEYVDFLCNYLLVINTLKLAFFIISWVYPCARVQVINFTVTFCSMRDMPPLPVSVNEDLANSLLPGATNVLPQVGCHLN